METQNEEQITKPKTKRKGFVTAIIVIVIIALILIIHHMTNTVQSV